MPALLSRLRARARTYVRDVWDNPGWLLMFALGRFLAVRRLLDRPAGPPPPAVTGSLFAAVDPAAVAAAVERDGVYVGLRLPRTLTAEIRAFAERTPCFGQFDRRVSFLPSAHQAAERRAGRALACGHYLDQVEACGPITRLRDDPLLRALAAARLGPRARPISTRLWWSFPAPEATGEDLRLASQASFHFDLDDWRALKFFFYLTDVGPGDGPHRYVRTSHVRRAWRHQFTLTVGQDDAEVRRWYGEDRVQTITGPAGLGFVEDPFGFHTGTPARDGPRLILEIGFGVGAGPRRRFHGEQPPAPARLRPPRLLPTPAPDVA